MAAFKVMKRLHGNIQTVEFVTHVGPRRLKHGGMKFNFVFPPSYFQNAADDVEGFLEERGLTRGEDYNIPGWNKYNTSYDNAQLLDLKLGGFYITFVDCETFVLTKMSWDLHDSDTS